jgi:polyhydroxybutyrate depolymerase
LYRCWDEVVPDGLDESPALLVDLHGWTDDPGVQREMSRFDVIAEDEGFVAVWPYGLAKSWNAGDDCCNPASKDGIDDVAFLRDLVDTVQEEHGTDPDRVYVTGLSNGCAMAHRFAVEASDVVAAMACMSMFLLVDAPSDYSPTPMMELHGTSDPLVAFEAAKFPGAVANFESLAGLNGCKGEPNKNWTSGASFTETFHECEGGADVALVTIDGGEHWLYEGLEAEVDTTALAWEFLSQFE